MKDRIRKALLGGVVVGGVALASTASMTLAGALFLVVNKVDPLQARPLAIVKYWQWYAGDPAQKKRLVGVSALSAVACFIVAPIAIANALRRRRSLHGDARFATTGEVSKAGLLGPKGIIVGKFGGRFITLPGQLFVLLAAPTRSGKDVGVVIPNMLNYPGSVVVNDIKGELFDKTSGFRARHGQAVYKFAPFDEQSCTHRYNPLGYVRNDPRYRVADMLSIGQVLYPNEGNTTGSEGFFNDQARNLFLALGLYLLDTPALPRTIGQMLRVASSVGKPLQEYLAGIVSERSSGDDPLADDTLQALSRFLSNPENTLGSILSTFNAPLSLFADPIVDLATSHNDFSISDVRRRPMSIYLQVPPNRLKDSRLLLNLFFTQTIYLNTQELPEHNPDLHIECLLVMNEFTALGKVGILSDAIGYIAGYNLRLLTVVQSMAQLASKYGDKDARNFATNHALRILYAPQEQQDAKEYSEMLGTFTERSESRGRSRSFGLKGGGSSSSVNESPQRRPLLLPQEFKELGAEREVVLYEKCKPILAHKIRYYEEKAFAERLLPPAAIPCQDIALHKARVEQRARLLGQEEANAVDLSTIAHDLSELPPLHAGSSEEEVTEFVQDFFDRLDRGQVPREHVVLDTPNTLEALDEVDLALLEDGAFESPSETSAS